MKKQRKNSNLFPVQNLKLERLLFALLLYFIFFGFSAFSQEEKNLEPVTINGDKVEYYPDKNITVAQGNVEVIYKGMFLYADKITLWIDKQEALAEGDVRIVKEGTTLFAEKLSYNLKENKGKLISPSFKNYGPWYGKGLEAEEVQKGKYIVKEAYITTCDRKKPDYRLEAKSLKMYLNERIIARDVKFYVKDLPVFYLPYFSRSLKDRRSPFLIIPGKDDDWGWYLLTSYRYYLNPNQRGRLKFDYREKKGFAQGIDHNYLTQFGQGRFRFYFMNEKDSSLSDNDRYRISFRHRWEPDSKTSIYAEYNKLSDQSFLKDYFYVEEYEKDPQPRTYFYLARRFPHFILNFNIKKRVNSFFNEVERLPEIGIDVNDLKIRESNFYYSSKYYFSNLTNKVANSELDDDVWRLDTYNEVSYVKRVFDIVNFAPYLGVRETFYSKDIEGDKYIFRGAFYTGFDSSIKFSKIFSPPRKKFLFSSAEAVKHTIMPIVRYAYIAEPTVSKERLLQFDQIDALARRSRLRLELENLWQIKYRDEENQQLRKRNLLRAILSGDYDFRIEGGSRWQQGRLLLEYAPYSWMQLESEARYDFKPGHFNTASLDLVINRKRWQLGFGHRYENDSSSQSTAEFKYRINEKWSFRTYQRYEFEEASPERQEFSIYRDLHCWLAEFTFINDRLGGNKSFFVIFTLKAFPKFPFRFSQSYRPPSY